MGSQAPLWLTALLVVCLAQPSLAFGAGNISSSSNIEGINWRHGDIEDALLGLLMARAMSKKNKPFTKVMVARVYFGNWLRDYSQAVDVGTVKSVSYEAIRLVVAILAFMNFGFGSKEFEVTPERLGCYRPEEHIDNPKGYAAGDDARRYWHGLRGPVDESSELGFDPESGMINYISNEHIGIATSSGLLRNLLSRCIILGRAHARDGDEDALYESMRLLGTALHCLEDFFAHSNYVELALIEMGEHGVFPHVGRDVHMSLSGAANDRVYPVVTGTFGEVDFMHSVAGEVSDKLKQNEMQELEQYLENGKNNDTSMLRKLLGILPSSIFGGENQEHKLDEIQENVNAAQMQNLQVTPHREPEEITKWVSDIFQQIVPIIEWHDRVMKIISDALPSIPILPKIIEQLEDQLNAFVMSTIAPFVVPVIQQIQNEMQAGSEGIIESSKQDQHRVFDDDEASDPTHSMLSKDHFTNLLNEPAGKTASEMVKWVVPQLMEAIDDEEVDIERTINRVVHGVLHHPAQRDQGYDGASEGREIFFRSVESWWNAMPDEKQDDYRQRLSREGVQNGENHKEGQWDSGHGHGCLGKLEQHSQHGGKKKKEEWDDKIATAAADAIVGGVTNALSGLLPQFLGSGGGQANDGGDDPSGLLGAAASIMGGIFGKDETGSSTERQIQDFPARNQSHEQGTENTIGYSNNDQYQGHHHPWPHQYDYSSGLQCASSYAEYTHPHNNEYIHRGESASYYDRVDSQNHGQAAQDNGTQHKEYESYEHQREYREYGQYGSYGAHQYHESQNEYPGSNYGRYNYPRY